jgi:hypothetical protein
MFSTTLSEIALSDFIADSVCYKIVNFLSNDESSELEGLYLNRHMDKKKNKLRTFAKKVYNKYYKQCTHKKALTL